MKLTILSHNLSSNAAMRAHRLALAAKTFAQVELIGPVERDGLWPAISEESWIRTVRDGRFPKFFDALLELIAAADGDVLVAVKPHLVSFGVGLLAAERQQVPIVLDIDDLDIALAPRSRWASNPEMADLARPRSPIYVSLLTRATSAASAITVSSTALQQRFGGTLIRHGSDTVLFDPDGIDRDSARRTFGFSGPTILFPGTPRTHKGLQPLLEATGRVPGARLVVTCRPEDLTEPEWQCPTLQRIPVVAYSSLPILLAAADVVAIPQLDTEPARYQMPMKVFDAMAMARPVVASAVSDLPGILEGCGRLVPPNDVEELAMAVTALLSNPEEARSMGGRARARCLEHYSMEQIGQRLSEVISRLER